MDRYDCRRHDPRLDRGRRRDPLFIAAETHADAESGLSDQQKAGLEREIQQIVDSIQFE